MRLEDEEEEGKGPVPDRRRIAVAGTGAVASLAASERGKAALPTLLLVADAVFVSSTAAGVDPAAAADAALTRGCGAPSSRSLPLRTRSGDDTAPAEPAAATEGSAGGTDEPSPTEPAPAPPPPCAGGGGGEAAKSCGLGSGESDHAAAALPAAAAGGPSPLPRLSATLLARGVPGAALWPKGRGCPFPLPLPLPRPRPREPPTTAPPPPHPGVAGDTRGEPGTPPPTPPPPLAAAVSSVLPGRCFTTWKRGAMSAAQLRGRVMADAASRPPPVGTTRRGSGAGSPGCVAACCCSSCHCHCSGEKSTGARGWL
jgi:hypothetical protein